MVFSDINSDFHNNKRTNQENGILTTTYFAIYTMAILLKTIVKYTNP